jgi:hypothetical protein
VSGVLHLPDDASPLRVYWALERFLRRQEAVVHSSIGVTGAVYAMPRDAWTPVPAGTLLDDVWVPMQLVLNGWRVGVAPGARAWDVRSFGAQDEVTRKTRTQTGVLQLLSLMPALLTATNPVRGCFIWHKLARLLTPLLVMMLGLAAVITAQPALAALDPTWWFATAMVCSLLLLVPRARRALWTWGRYLLGMQWALLQAARMASRGQWGVWRPTDQ